MFNDNLPNESTPFAPVSDLNHNLNSYGLDFNQPLSQSIPYLNIELAPKWDIKASLFDYNLAQNSVLYPDKNQHLITGSETISYTDSLLSSGVKEIAFVDSKLDNYQSLIQGVSEQAQVFILDSNRNEIQQISQVLGNYQNLDAVHLFSHGFAGGVQLGNTILNLGNLNNYSNDFSIWGQSLIPTGDFLLYGCNVAEGIQGQNFVQQLSQFTGADIAASIDLTGNANLGGDWDLEYQSKKIEARSFNYLNYDHLLGTIALNNGELLLEGDDAGNSTSDLENVYVSVDNNQLVIKDTEEQIQINGSGITKVDDNTVTVDINSINKFKIITDKDPLDGDRINIDLSSLTTPHKFDLEIKGDRYDDAVTFTGNVSNFGGKIDVDVRDIYINEGVVISTRQTNGNSGNIILKGKEIYIKDNAQLLADGSSGNYLAGDINIEATKFWIPSSDPAAFLTDLGLFGSFDDSRIIVGKSTIFKGNNINFSTDTGGTTEQANLLQEFTASGLRTLVDLIVGIPVMLKVKKAESIINIGDNSQIIGSGNINLESYANADIDIAVVGGDSESDLGQSNDSFLKKFSFGLGVGITKAETTIGGNVMINANKNVSILSDAFTNSSVDSRTSQNLGIKPTSKDNKALAFGISYSEANSYTNVAQGAIITAGGNANVLAIGENYNKSAGRAYIYQDGTAGIALGLEISASDIRTEVNGTINAGGATGDIIVNLDDNNLINNVTSQIQLISPHNFKNGDAVVYKNGDADGKIGGNDSIGGLIHQQVYYVIVDSPNQIRLAESRSKALAKQAIAIDKDDKTGTGHHLHALKGLGTIGIGVKSYLESRDIVQADSGIFNNTALNKIINFDSSAISSGVRTTIGDKLKNTSEAQAAQNQKDLDAKVKAGDKVQKPTTTQKLSQKAFPGTDNNSTGESSKWGLAGSLAVTIANHDVTTKIGATAKLASQQDLEVNSFHQSITQIEAITDLQKASTGVEGPSKETAISASVSAGFYDSDVKTEIADGAKLDASGNLNIQSEIVYPFAWENADLTDISVASSASELTQWWDDFITGKESVLDSIDSTISVQYPHKAKPWSSWTKSASQAEKKGFSGSINVLSFNNTNQTIVGSGVEINQNQAYRNLNQAVNIQANTDITLINITGDPLSLTKSIGGKGVGGSVFFLLADNTTEAIVKDGAKIYTGSNQKFSLKANTDVFSTVMAISGGAAEEFGIAGTVVVNLQYNRTISQLGSGAIVTGGGLDIIAQDDTDHWNFVGGIIRGNNTGIGMSVGVHNIGREVQALIGNSSDLAPGSNTNIDVNGDINVKALSEGNIYTLSLAAAVITQPTPQKPSPGPTPDATPGMSASDPSAEVDDPIDINLIKKSTETGSPTDGIEKRPETPEAAPKGTTGGENVANDQGKQGKSGIGISGDVSIHLVNDKVLAYVNDSGQIKTLGNISITANNDTDLYTISGSASFVNKPNASSTGIAGSVAVNLISGDTKAYIAGKNTTTGKQLTLSANSLSLEATRTGDIFSISAGGSGALGSKGIAIAGSVSVNNITNTTESYIDGGVLVLLTDLLIKAKDESDIFAIAGALAFGGRAGVGAAIGVNIINNDTKATLKNSSLNYTGKLDISAENNTEIQALSGAIGASSGNLGGAGTVSVNIINGETTAFITNINTQKALSVINLKANNNAKIQSLSGAVGASKGMGFGAAIAYNGINDSTSAYITGSNLGTNSSLTIAANSNRTIQTISLGLAGGKDLGLAGSVSVNIIDGSLAAYIADSTVTANGKVEVTAIASDDIEALAGAVGISLGNGGVGAGISINQISNGNRAYITGSTITSQNDLSLKAQTSSEISTISIGAAGGKTFALGGSIAVNTINNTSKASIEANSNIQAAKVNLTGKDNSTIESLAGAVGLSTGSAAIAASVAVNYISNEAQAYIDRSTVKATSNVGLTADAAATIKSLSASGAVTTGSGAVSGSFSINIIGGATKAYIANGANVTGTGISLSANNNSKIQSLAGNVAGAGTGAVGISLAVNDLDNGIYAYIDNSNVTATNNQISLSATSKGDIASASVGGAGAGTFAVGGSVSINNIDTATKAYVANNSQLNAAQLISIKANDDSEISSIAGQVAVGGTAGIGASVSTNYISNAVNAYITGSQVTSMNNGLTIQADISPTVENITAGGAGAGTFAVGGSVTVNHISTQVLAYIGNNSTIQTQQNINILATNNATIRSLAGQISGAGTAAIGAAVAINNSSGLTSAYIANSNVSTGGAIKVAATGTNTIESLSAGASVSGQVALTGSVSVNNITDTITAYAINRSLSGNSLEISAQDNSTIKSLAGQLSASLGGSVGAAVAYNNIGNTVKAYSQDATINTTGNVLINANNQGTIETVAVGGSFGLYVGLAGSVAVNEMTNTTSAYIQGGNVTASGSVGVLANSVNSMTTGGGAISGGLAGVGATIVVNNLNNTTQAYLLGANVNALGNNSLTVPLADGSGNTQVMSGLAVIATSKENLNTTIGTVSAGGLGLAGSIAVNSFQDKTQAYINGGNINKNNTGANSQQSVLVKAANDSNVDIKAGAGAFGGAGVGATIDVTTVKNGTFAYINNATVNTLKDIEVEARTKKNVNSVVVAAAGGVGLGISGAISIVNVSAGMSSDANQAADDTKSIVDARLVEMDGMGKDSSGNSNINTKKDITNDLSTTPTGIQGTTAFIGGTINAGGNIYVYSDETTKLGVIAGAVAYGGFLGAGGSVGIANVTHNTSAYVAANAVLSAGGNIGVQANGLIDQNKVQAIAGTAGLVGLGAAVAYLTSHNNTNAYIGAGTTINQANNINVLAGSSSNSQAEAWGASAGAVAAGVVIANTEETGTTQAYLGNNVTIQNTHNLTVNATAKEVVSAIAQAASGGIVSGNGSVPEANISPTVKAYIGDNSKIQVNNDVQVISDATVDGDAEAKGVSIGALAVGVSLAEVNAKPNIDTYIGADVNLNANNVTVKSLLGKPLSSGDNAFNPANTVNNGSDTINFGKEHGFQTGETVVYLNGGGTDIGGLTSGSSYQVIKVDNQTLKLGSEFDASKIDIPANKITFSRNHAFTNGQKVVYEAVGGAAIGGLTSGNSYYVKVLDSKTIKLVPAWPDPSVTQAATLANIAANQITINSHGFSNGDLVTYQTRSAQVAIVNTIPADAKGKDSIFNLEADLTSSDTFNSAKHGFDNGEEIVYSTTGTAIGGLTSGQKYFVIKVDDNHFKLSATKNGTAINLTSAAQASFHSITALNVTGLETGKPYYVVGATANSFQLSATKAGVALTLGTTGLTGTGTNHLFSKDSAIDLTSASSGQHNLHFDLDNSTATGDKHSFSTGAVATVPSQGDNQFSVYAQASAGALIGGTGTEATLNITPTMNTYVGDRTSITAKGNVAVTGLASVSLTGGTDASISGAIAVGASEINVTIDKTNNTYIGTSAKIKADGNIQVTSQSDQNLAVKSYGGAGSAITFADSEAHANITHNTTTTIKNNAELISNDTLLLGSSSNTDTNVKAAANGAGIYADADADSSIKFDGSNTTNVNANVRLEGRHLNVTAIVDTFKVESRAESEGAGLIGNIDAHAKVDLTGSDAVVNIATGAYLKGDEVNLNAEYKNVVSRAIAEADCDGLGGDTDSDATNIMPLVAKVQTEVDSTIEATILNVESDFESFNKTTKAHSDLAWELDLGLFKITMDFGEEEEDEKYTPKPWINFNSTVIINRHDVNPILVIDTNGNIIQQSNNITANITATEVIVDDVENVKVGGINFIIPQRTDKMFDNGEFTDNGKYSVNNPAYDTVQIINNSSKDLVINDISVINIVGLPEIKYDQVNVKNKNIATTNIPPVDPLPVNPTVVTIENNGNSNLVLQGIIDSPHDRTDLVSTGGIIGRDGHKIITRDLSLTAVNGSIGTDSQRIIAQLNQDYHPITDDVPSSKINLQIEAKNSVFLDLTAKQLDSNPVTVNVAKMTATTGDINLLINQTTDSTNTPVAALYEFTKIITGNNIIINAGTTSTNLQGNTDFVGNTSFLDHQSLLDIDGNTGNIKGTLDVVTGGYIELTEVAGGVNLKQLVSDQDYIKLTVNESSNLDENLLLIDNANISAAKNISFLVGDNFQINTTATIISGQKLVINADKNNQDTNGSLVNIFGAIYSQGTELYTEKDSDIFNVRRIDSKTYLGSKSGDDVINVGSKYPTTGGLLDNIDATLTISGGIGKDILNVNDSGDSKDNIAIVTDNEIRGLGMGGKIDYGSFEKLNLQTGDGEDNVTVESTHNGETNLNTADGNDNIYIESIYGDTTVRSAQGDDHITVSSSQQLLDNIANTLTVSGGIGGDILNLDDSGDSKDNIAIVTDNEIRGLGMGGKIDYGSFEKLNLQTGDGADNVTVESTHNGETNLNTAGGNDNIYIESIYGDTTVITGNEGDTVNVENSSLLSSVLIVDGKKWRD
ncbi:DUF4347 domain-containing protein [Nostoc linckia FACHB-104]|nr:DUF4347 domain-containing protein [Nostoc linckia FACHB-104]